MDDEVFAAVSHLVALLGEYRQISRHIVNRHDRARYVLRRDRDLLDTLNRQVDELERSLTRIGEKKNENQ